MLVHGRVYCVYKGKKKKERWRHGFEPYVGGGKYVLKKASESRQINLRGKSCKVRDRKCHQNLLLFPTKKFAGELALIYYIQQSKYNLL